MRSIACRAWPRRSGIAASSPYQCSATAAPIGSINVAGAEPAMFSDRQIAMLKTFADQAVIAIENTRLFKELETRNRDLTEALEQQTATSEILRVISQSQRDVQPVFETIAANARKLCEATYGGVFTFDGELINVAAAAGASPEALETIHRDLPDAAEPRRCDRPRDSDSSCRVRAGCSSGSGVSPSTWLSDGVSQRRFRSHAPRRQSDRSDRGDRRRTRNVLRTTDRHASDLRRPGGHRD